MNAQNHVRIGIVDTQFLITESLKVILNNDSFCVCKIANTYYELEKFLETSLVELLITDLTSIDHDGFEEIRSIKQKYPQLRILVLTNLLSRNDFSELTKIGIKNIVYKTADREELFNAIEATIKGKKYFNGEILDMLLELGSNKRNTIEEHVQLTSSEREIVRLITQGLTTKVIADKKNISFHTVMTHRKNIFRKLGINNASELLKYAIKTGLADTLEYHI